MCGLVCGNALQTYELACRVAVVAGRSFFLVVERAACYGQDISVFTERNGGAGGGVGRSAPGARGSLSRGRKGGGTGYDPGQRLVPTTGCGRSIHSAFASGRDTKNSLCAVTRVYRGCGCACKQFCGLHVHCSVPYIGTGTAGYFPGTRISGTVTRRTRQIKDGLSRL